MVVVDDEEEDEEEEEECFSPPVGNGALWLDAAGLDKMARAVEPTLSSLLLVSAAAAADATAAALLPSMCEGCGGGLLERWQSPRGDRAGY